MVRVDRGVVSLMFACIAAAGNMYSYGGSQNDVSLPPLDDYSHGPINIPVNCFPFGLRRHHSVYVGILQIEVTVILIYYGILYRYQRTV